MLVWTLVRAGSHGRGKTHPLRVLLTPDAAGVRLRVAGHGFLGRATPLRDRDHRALEVDHPPGKGQQVPCPYGVRGAHPRAIDVHFAAGYGLGGEGAGFEEAHAEEPAIDACASRA